MTTTIFRSLFLVLLFLSQNVIAQTAVGTINQIPCDNDGVYTVTTTGFTLPVTYTYYTGNGIITHANVNSATDVLTNIEMSNYGYIGCNVSDGSSNASAQNSYAPNFSFYTSSTWPVCPATLGTITATQQNGSPGPFSFVWTNTQSLNTYTGNNATVPLGSYTLEITDQTTGCVMLLTDSVAYVGQLSNVTATVNITQASCTNGTATAIPSGGVAPYTYLWNNGAITQTISGLSQGWYNVIVTDAQGCSSGPKYASVQQVPSLNINTTSSNPTCLQADGSIIAFASGGVGPYTYVWSNGQTGNTASNLTGGSSYTVIATDANGCVGQNSTFLSSNTPITVGYNATPSQCTSATGSATLNASGGTAPYSYSWSSFPAVSGPTISNANPGTYSFTVTDDVGCIRSGNVLISPVSTINAFLQGSSVICPANTGNASATVSGSNPPFTFLWSNGATTQNITGVPIGSYSCVITDDIGCSVTKNALVKSISPLNLAISTTPVSCLFANDGGASVNVFGGTPPYTYAYSNGSSVASASNLAKGVYNLVVTDANGCTKLKTFTIGNANTSTSCYCTISGQVYFDANADCVKDPSENGIEDIMIHCSGYGYTFTDANGFYSFRVPTGSYTITEQINPYYPLSSCQNNNVSLNVVAAAACNSVVDFANDLVPIHDLKITTVNASTPPIPGNPYQQKVIVSNHGTITESGIQMGYEHDGQLAFLNSTLPTFVQLNSVGAPYSHSVQSGFPTLNPNQSSTMLLNYSTPTNIPLGTSVMFIDTVTDAAPMDVNWLLDETPWNNVNTYQTTVIGSYDPNYKEVYPIGIGAEGFISSDVSEFDYTIHFQNEGTYFAQNIVITDQLDNDLEWTTFRPGYSDYNYTVSISETGLVTFTFANINLPWKSSYGDALSSGLVNYSIQRKASSPQGTEFTNEANIYFDFNEPITTNTTLNTLKDDATPIRDFADDVKDLTTVNVFPVPTKDMVTISINNLSSHEQGLVTVVDVMGKVVLSSSLKLRKGVNASTHDFSGLTKGAYFARVSFEDGTFITKKIILF